MRAKYALMLGIKLVRVFQVQFVEASTHTKKEWYRIGMFRALVDEMYA